jgi:hypothetical protein
MFSHQFIQLKHQCNLNTERIIEANENTIAINKQSESERGIFALFLFALLLTLFDEL